jgi:arylsulfatase A-like enzyme
MKSSVITKISIIIIIVILIIGLSIAGGYLYNNSGARRIKHIVLISMDTTRADALSCYGNKHKTTPNIDALAAEGVLFENAIAPTPLTLPSHSTMLTGTTPLYHGIHDNIYYQLDKSHVTLAEILKKKGFSTAAFIGSFMLDSQFGLDQGFDYYNDEFEDVQVSLGINERRAGETSRLACEWIDDHYKENMFLFLHFYDPHMKYDPPEPFDSMFTDSSLAMSSVIAQFSLYTGEIAYADHCIGQVINKLKSLSIYDSTLIIVTGDHGEMLGEHKEITHGFFIYRSVVRVPLVFKLPGRSRQARVKNTVGLADIVPTICSLLNIEPSSDVQGKDITPYLIRNDPVNLQKHVYCESLTPTKYKCNTLLALVSDRYKYIQTTRPELYDIIEDPKESNNLIDQDPNLEAQNPESKRARLLKKRLQQIIERTVKEGSSNQTEFDEETIARLESLGYVSGGITEDFSFDQSLNDPKDRITYHILDSRVIPRIYQKKFDEAREMSEQMISLRPELYQGYLNLARIALEEKDFATAVKVLKKAIRCDPNQYVVHGELAAVLFEEKEFDQSLFHVQESLRLNPRYHKGLYTLAGHAWLRATSTDDEHYDPPQALKLARQAIELTPETKKRAGQLHALAAAYAANGNFPEAVENGRLAVQLAMTQGNKQLVRDIIKHMKLYRNNKPYRE